MKHIATPALWHEFYKTAQQFCDLAPWKWFEGTRLFGIKNPATGEIGWCCIMGSGGEHFGLAIYRGAKGLKSCWNLSDANGQTNGYNPEVRNTMHSQDCWMVSFEDANYVAPEQKKHLKALDLKFRGAAQWIVAQSFDVGYTPWLLDEKDLPYLIQCLQQAMDVSIRYEDNDGLLDDNGYLVREASQQNGALQWMDTYLNEEDVEELYEEDAIQPSAAFKKAVSAMPHLNGAVVVSNILMRKSIQENSNVRPWTPMLLVAMQYESGYMFAQETIRHAELRSRVEGFLLGIFKTIKGVPIQLCVHHTPLYDMLEELAEVADIHLVLMTGDEPVLTDFMESLSNFGM